MTPMTRFRLYNHLHKRFREAQYNFGPKPKERCADKRYLGNYPPKKLGE